MHSETHLRGGQNKNLWDSFITQNKMTKYICHVKGMLKAYAFKLNISLITLTLTNGHPSQKAVTSFQGNKKMQRNYKHLDTIKQASKPPNVIILAF